MKSGYFCNYQVKIDRYFIFKYLFKYRMCLTLGVLS